MSSARVVCEELSTWAIAVGSLAIVASHVLGGEQPNDSLVVRGTMASRGDRLWYALAGGGAALVAFGGILLGIIHPPSLWVLLVPVVGYVAFHLLMAWKLRQLLIERREGARRSVARDDAAWAKRLTILERWTKWRWCLLHVYGRHDEWPA